MKINPNYRLRKIGGKTIVVSLNGMNLDGVLTMNQTAEFIWNKIDAGAEADEIIEALAAECNVSQDEIRDEAESFINALKGAGIIE